MNILNRVKWVLKNVIILKIECDRTLDKIYKNNEVNIILSK